MSKYSKLRNTNKTYKHEEFILVIHYVVLSDKYNIFTHVRTHTHSLARAHKHTCILPCALVLCFSKVIVLCSFI